jgi:DNA-binding MarR family transcriptional regulator
MLVRLGRFGCGDELGARLTPAQWMALRFFARANQFSKTPSAFARFHGTTRGTASQTIKSLISAGFLKRHRAKSDGRRARLELTAAGERVLKSDGLHALEEAIKELPLAGRRILTQCVQELTSQLANRRGAPEFGTCQDCLFFTVGGKNAGYPCYCEYANVALLADELDQLCVDYKSRTAVAAERAE